MKFPFLALALCLGLGCEANAQCGNGSCAPASSARGVRYVYYPRQAYTLQAASVSAPIQVVQAAWPKGVIEKPNGSIEWIDQKRGWLTCSASEIAKWGRAEIIAMIFDGPTDDNMRGYSTTSNAQQTTPVQSIGACADGSCSAPGSTYTVDRFGRLIYFR